MADLYAKMGRHDEAVEHYQKAVDLNPTFAFSQRKIGDNLVFMGRYDEGRAAFRKAMEMEVTPGGKVTDMERIARSYLYECKYQESLAEADKAVTMAAEADLPERAATLLSMKCQVFIEAGELDQAEQSLAECKQVVTESDLSLAVKETYAKDALFTGALIAAKRQDFETALAKADEYKAKIEAGHDPKQMEKYHSLLGSVHLEQGAYAEAIGQFKQIRRRI